MYLMYVDESGDPGTDPNSPTQYFILSSIVLHELRWIPLLDSLVDLRRYLRETKGLKLREEIHATALINRPGDLRRIKRHDRVDIMKQCIDWVASNHDISVTTICVNKNNRKQQDDVFEFAWKLLIQRFENTLSYNNFPGPRNPDDKGMVFPDNTDGEKLTKLMRRMRRYNPVPHKSGLNVAGYRNMNLQAIIEDPMLKESKKSFFTQIVDVVAYSARQLYETNNYMKKKGGHNFYKRLKPVLNTHASSSHPLGIVEV